MKSKIKAAAGILTIFFTAGFATLARAENFDGLQGQLNLKMTFLNETPSLGSNGISYLPSLRKPLYFGERFKIDGEATVNIHAASGREEGQPRLNLKKEVTPHRFWGRIFSDDIEARLGLQKISFGPGKTLRALQWFDHIDPHDPTAFTKGVQAALMRGYLENNTNLWGWILYGNRDAIGISPFSTAREQPEFGGRIQFPVRDSELAFSFHQRSIEANLHSSQSHSDLKREEKTENRIGFDGQWDLGFGLWTEWTLIQIEKSKDLPRQHLSIALGGDYTFDVGNGLYCSLEVMQNEVSSDSQEYTNKSERIMAWTQQYPLDLLDQLSLITLWNSEQEGESFYGSWKRIYDDTMINMSLFYKASPKRKTGQSQPARIEERGIQFVIQYNH
ncbi:MAG: hypothetical protein HQM13_01155 [SAR324 cluster bacterium]|nr:hypothetical protein [SAR324 cluster bacterium]